MILAIAVLLTACATGGVNVADPNFTKDFSAGNLRLTCTLACAGTAGANRSKLTQFYTQGNWLDLAREVAKVGYENEREYFYLGVAAQQLGYKNAARIYYNLALDTKYKCGSVQGCDGFTFPRDIQTQLSSLDLSVSTSRKNNKKASTIYAPVVQPVVAQTSGKPQAPQSGYAPQISSNLGLIERSGGLATYIDRDSVQRVGDMAYFTIITDAKKPDSEGRSSQILKYEMNCSKEIYRNLFTRNFAGSMGSGKVIGSWDEPERWLTINKDGWGAKYYVQVCGKSPQYLSQKPNLQNAAQYKSPTVSSFIDQSSGGAYFGSCNAILHQAISSRDALQDQEKRQMFIHYSDRYHDSLQAFSRSADPNNVQFARDAIKSQGRTTSLILQIDNDTDYRTFMRDAVTCIKFSNKF